MVTRPRNARDWIIQGKTGRSGQNKTSAKSGARSSTPRTGTSGAEEAARAAASRIGTSGAEQAAGAAAPSTGSTRDERRHVAPDWIIRGGTSRRSQLPRTGSTRDKRRLDAPGWIIRVGSSSRTRRTPDWIIRGRTTTRSSHNPQDWINRGKEACRRGVFPGADQAEGVPSPRAGASVGKWRPEPNETRGRGRGGAAKESRPEATQRTTPWGSSDAKMRRRLRSRSTAKIWTGPR